MKKILLILVSLLPILFNGCAKHYAFEKDNIGLQTNKYYSKVENTTVCVNQDNKVIKRYPRDMAIFATQTMEMDVNDIATKIAYENLKQYFKNIKLEKNVKSNCGDIVVIVDTPDYHFYFNNINGSGYIQYDVSIQVIRNGKTILNKKYHLDDNDHILLKVVAGFGTKTSDSVAELYHKSLFNLFETQIKQDIINAL